MPTRLVIDATSPRPEMVGCQFSLPTRHITVLLVYRSPSSAQSDGIKSAENPNFKRFEIIIVQMPHWDAEGRSNSYNYLRDFYQTDYVQ